MQEYGKKLVFYLFTLSFYDSRSEISMSSLNATPAGERVHIGLFGRRNAGKSSLINALKFTVLWLMSAKLQITFCIHMEVFL